MLLLAMDVVRERHGGEYGIFISGIYEKDRDFYRMRAKFLMGIMILAQFTAPLRAVLLDGEGELWEEVERFQTELEAAAGNIVWDYEEENEAAKALEKEVEAKLEPVAGEYGFAVREVKVYGNPPKVEVAVYKEALMNPSRKHFGMEIKMEKEGKTNTVPNEKEIPPKRWFRKREKRAKMGKDQFVICILAGILLIVIAVPSTEKTSRKAAEYGLLDSKSDIIEENNGSEDDIGLEIEKINSTEEYERYMENKLEQAISVMEGAGKVKVIVTVSASKELVVEKDMPVTRSNTVENDSEGGSRNVNELNSMEETVYDRKSDGTSSPYVVKTLQPLVEGVVVIAQGGDRPEVKKNITEAIVALFDIEPHKIKIVKMKSE